MRTLRERTMNAAALAVLLLVPLQTPAGNLDGTNTPASTMHTLDEIYQKTAAYGAPQTLSATTTAIQAGYYANTNLTAVDADLKEENIKQDVVILGVSGTYESGAIYTNSMAGRWKTGQTATYVTGDDGYYQKGFAWPSPRFTVGTAGEENCVVDNLTGLMWLGNPDSTGRVWSIAVAYCESLNGDNGRGGYTDWRLPNLYELESLVDRGHVSPAAPTDCPFRSSLDLQHPYWTSTSFVTVQPDGPHAFYVDMNTGITTIKAKTNYFYAVAVRGGQ